MNDPRKYLKVEYKVLSDPNSSQEARREALESLDAKRRQVPAQSQRDKQTGVHAHVAPEASIEQEMLRQPQAKHGFPCAPGFQEFSTTDVRLDPSLVKYTYNTSNPGFSSPSAPPSEFLYRGMSNEERNFVDSCVAAIRRMNSSQGVSVDTLVERFERSNSNYKPQDLYCLKVAVGALKEEFQDTASHWVVINPFSGKASTSLEAMKYNQVGTTGTTASQVEKMQQGTYWRQEEMKQPEVGKQVPPAKPQVSSDNVDYSAGTSSTTRSARSLKNSQRGDDYIRNSRIKMSQNEQAIIRLQDRYETLQEQLRYEVNTYTRGRLVSEMKGVSNLITSAKASISDQKNKKPQHSTQSYANKVSQMNSSDSDKLKTESLEESHSYDRHLSLLDECKNMMGKFSDSGWS